MCVCELKMVCAKDVIRSHQSCAALSRLFCAMQQLFLRTHNASCFVVRTERVWWDSVCGATKSAMKTKTDRIKIEVIWDARIYDCKAF